MVTMPLDRLPNNALVTILMLLDYKSILRMKAISKTWLAMISCNQGFWKEKFEADFGAWEGGDVDFEEEYKIEYGWRFKDPNMSQMNGHTGVVSDVRVLGDTMVSGSWDMSVRLWNLERMECAHVFRVNQSVHSVAFNNERIFAGLENGEIHVWFLVSGEFAHSWHAHDREPFDILRVCVSDNYLVSAGGDGLVKSWDASNYACLQMFNPQRPSSLHIDGDEIVCGVCEAYKVHGFHQDGRTMYTLELDNPSWLHAMCANSKHIFVGGMWIDVWDMETKQQVALLRGNGGVGRHINNVMACDSRKLVSHLSPGMIHIWDAIDLTWIKMIDLHGVWSISCSGRKLVVGLTNGAICVFDFCS